MAADIVTSILLVVGCGFVLLAGIGLQRFDDVFARIHAATKAPTLGLLFIVLGAALQVENQGDTAKLLLAATLQFITGPVSAHMVGRAAYRAGTELSPDTAVDELADARQRRTGDPEGIADPPPPEMRGD